MITDRLYATFDVTSIPMLDQEQRLVTRTSPPLHLTGFEIAEHIRKLNLYIARFMDARDNLAKVLDEGTPS